MSEPSDADILVRASFILRKRYPAGDRPKVESARLLLLALAMKIRAEKAARNVSPARDNGQIRAPMARQRHRG